MDLADLGAAQLARRIAAGEISSLEVTEACLRRIDSREPEIKAWVHLDPEFARAQATKCDQLRASGAAVGPLHGVPVGVKDIFDTQDFPTENGTILDRGRSPVNDCTAVRRLKAAGCVIMGKTVTTELAVYAPGKTTNPKDINRTPGGSSSGSAAAVACGMVPIAIGSQTNGSVIRPASFCGVIGFKPSHGQISRSGALSLSRNLDHVGVFARSVEDAALVTDSLTGFDPDDTDTRLTAATKLHETALQEPPIEPKFGFLKTQMWDRAEPATQAAFEELVDFLGDACKTIEMPNAFHPAVENLRKIMTADLAKSLSAYVDRGKSQLSDILQGMIDDGNRVSAVDYNRAVDARAGFNLWVEEVCSEYDALIAPATIGEAPLGLTATGDPVFCSTWSYLGVPALSLPLMQGVDGMPLGVQLVSARGDDARLLRTARWLMETTFNGIEN